MTTMFQTFYRALHDTFTNYNVVRICEIPIMHSFDSGDSEWQEWRSTLEKCLPQFDEHGWLDGLARIKVGDQFTDERHIGKYKSMWGTILLSNPQGYTIVKGAPPKEETLLHEMIHHVHMREEFGAPAPITDTDILRYQEHRQWGIAKPTFREVNTYAGENVLEAVAVTGAKMAYGTLDDDEAEQLYYKFGGPEIPDDIV